jgi:ATP-dependent exoDNAse (exonuclease V) beta subunit
MISTLDRREMHAVLSMLSKGEAKRSIAQELMSVVDEAYTAARGCDARVWDKISVNKQPIQADIENALAAFRSASPKQRRLVEQLANVITALECHDFESLSESTLLGNIAKARRAHSEIKFGSSKFPDGLDEAFDTLYAAIRSRTLALLASQNEATASVLKMYDDHVMQLKHAARTIGFDDVAFQLAAQLGDPDHEALANRLDGAIDHILLDEFQDTSPVQWQVLRPLAKQVTEYMVDSKAPIEEEHAERSFFCVGDKKQAIYGWRGGVAEIFDAVSSQLPGVGNDYLDTSYRSSSVVIEFVNNVFKKIDSHPKLGNTGSGNPSDQDFHRARALQRFAGDFPQHHTAKTDLAGYVRMETTHRKESDNLDPNFLRAAEIADQIHREAPDKEIGILTRSNSGVADVIRCLRDHQVEVSQEGGNPLTDSAAVELILSALMMSEHPGDKRWKFHTEHSPLAQIPDFGPDLVRDWVTDRGLAETVERLADSLADCCDDQDTIRLKQLVQLTIGYEANAVPRVRDFVQMVEQQRVERPQAAKIRVMTVHQSKGLEFDTVILPELEGAFARIDGQCIPKVAIPGDPPEAMTRYVSSKVWHYFPEAWQAAFGSRVAQATNEAICLLYVAITRARQAVHIVIRPPTKEAFENKHAGALVYHALPNKQQPNLPNKIMYESGNPHWYR